MVCHPALGKVIGSDPLVAHPGADLTAALPGDGLLPFLFRPLVEPGAEDREGAVLVLILAPLILALDHRARGQVGHPDGGLGLVDVLSPGPGGPEGVDAQVIGVQGKVHLVHLGQHGHRAGGGVDAPAGLRLRDPLDAVHPALVLESGVGRLALDQAGKLLHAPQLGLIDVRQLQPPALLFAVHGVHAEEVRGKQRRFLAPDARPDLQENIFPVHGVLGLEQETKLFFQPVQLRTERRLLGLGQLAALRVVQQIGQAV